MKPKTLLMAFLVLVMPFNSLLTLAGQSDDWAAVRAIGRGEKVRVQLKDGKKIDGQLSSVTDTTITVDRKNNTTDYPRDSVAKVHRVVPGSRGKSVAKAAAIGAGIGFGTGAGVGIAAGNYEDLGTAELVGILGGIGAAIGAGIGAAIGSIGRKEKRELVYQTR